MIQEDVSLRHNLTDKEMAALAREQANAIESLKVTKSEVEAIKKDYGGRIALAEAQIGSISARVNTGWEMRNVKCLITNERPEGYRVTIRLDNGHITRRRKLDPEERQLKLSTEPPKQLFASVILPVDDELWDVDFYEQVLFEDEVEAMKNIPDLQFKSIQNRRGLIESGKPDGKKK